MGNLRSHALPGQVVGDASHLVYICEKQSSTWLVAERGAKGRSLFGKQCGGFV